MKKMEIMGEQYSIAFNMATELAYEQLTGTAFDPQAIVKCETSEQVVNIASAVLIANNQDKDIDIQKLLHEASRQEMVGLFRECLAAMMEWLRVPAIAESHVPEPTDEEKEEAAEKKD